MKKLLTIFLLLIFIPLAYAQYTAKEVKILTYEIVLSETWETAFDINSLVGEQARTTVRKWKLKARENDDTDVGFDYNFLSATPTYWATNSGTGFGQDGTALPQNIFIRARDASTIIELVYYQ